jgi:hypothetical protein
MIKARAKIKNKKSFKKPLTFIKKYDILKVSKNKGGTK